MHFVAFEKIRLPVTVGPTEKTETIKPTATRMRYCIDLVKFKCDQLWDDAFVCVVDNASTLNNVDRFVLGKALGGPARVVWVGKVITVEDTNDVSSSVKREEVVEVVGFGFRVWHLGHNEVLVQLLHGE